MAQRATRRKAVTRRQHILGAAGALGAAALAACGPLAAPSQPKLVQSATEITWTFWDGPMYHGFINATAEAFERAFPQAKVQRVNLAFPYDDKVLTMITGGTPPDVVGTLRFTATSWAVKGISLALDPFLARGGFKENEYFPNAVTPWRVEGKLYALPREVDLWTLWYNKALFDEAGIKPPDETWTWETLIDRAQRLTKRDGPRVQFGYGTGGFAHKMWVALGKQNGSTLWDREVLPTRLLINQPAVTDALQWVADLRHRWRVMPSAAENQEHGANGQLFQTGRLAMFFAEAFAASGYATTIKDFAYDVAVPAKGKQHGTWLGGACYSVPRSSTKREPAVQFLLFASGPDGQRVVAEHRWAVPTIKRIADSDLFLKSAPPANKKAWRQSFEWGAGPPMTPTWPEIERALNTELAQTWAGTRSAKDSVAAAWSQVEDYLRQAQDMVKQIPR